MDDGGAHIVVAMRSPCACSRRRDRGKWSWPCSWPSIVAGARRATLTISPSTAIGIASFKLIGTGANRRETACVTDQDRDHRQHDGAGEAGEVASLRSRRSAGPRRGAAHSGRRVRRAGAAHWHGSHVQAVGDQRDRPNNRPPTISATVVTATQRDHRQVRRVVLVVAFAEKTWLWPAVDMMFVLAAFTSDRPARPRYQLLGAPRAVGVLRRISGRAGGYGPRSLRHRLHGAACRDNQMRRRGAALLAFERALDRFNLGHVRGTRLSSLTFSILVCEGGRLHI